MRAQIFAASLSLRGRTEERQYFCRVKASIPTRQGLLACSIKVHQNGPWTHFSHQPACLQAHQGKKSNPLVIGQTQIQATAWHEKKNRGHVGLRGARCHCADFKAYQAQIGRARVFGALDSLAKCRNRMLCTESVGILQPAEIKAMWPEKCVGKLRWHANDFSGASDSPPECWIVSAIAGT